VGRKKKSLPLRKLRAETVRREVKGGTGKKRLASASPGKPEKFFKLRTRCTFKAIEEKDDTRESSCSKTNEVGRLERPRVLGEMRLSVKIQSYASRKRSRLTSCRASKRKTETDEFDTLS